MCYHSGRNTCTICGCPNNTIKSHEAFKHVEDMNTDRHSSPYSTVPSMQVQVTSSSTMQMSETPDQLIRTSGKLQTLPSRNIQELYSQRKSSSPDMISYQTRPGGATDRTNLYKPTSLHDFKKLLSIQPSGQGQEKHLPDYVDSECNGLAKNTDEPMKNFGSLKNPSLWMDNRFSIIQEEPDLHEKRKSAKDLLQNGFLV